MPRKPKVPAVQAKATPAASAPVAGLPTKLGEAVPLTAEMVAQLTKSGVLSPAEIKPSEASRFYANAFKLFLAGNDATLILQAPRPAQNGEVAIVEEIAFVQFSVASLKDLSIIVLDVLGSYEKSYGPIETPYTRKREADKKAPPKTAQKPEKKAKPTTH